MLNLRGGFFLLKSIQGIQAAFLGKKIDASEMERWLFCWKFHPQFWGKNIPSLRRIRWKMG